MKFKTNSEVEMEVDIEQIAKNVIAKLLEDLLPKLLRDDPGYYGVPTFDEDIYKDPDDCYAMIENEVVDYISEKMNISY